MQNLETRKLIPREEPDHVPRKRRKPSRFGKPFVAYVPPARARRTEQLANDHERNMMEQQIAWTSMKKRINGIINRINKTNVKSCAFDLLRLNIIRGKGLFCKSVMRAQLASIHFSSIYAALVSVVNTRIPEVGELLVHRLIAQLRKGYADREKVLCSASLRLLSHLFIHQIIDELPLLEFLSTCLVDPSDGSIELVVLVIQECGHFLAEKSPPQAIETVYSRLREILHDGSVGYRTQILVDNAMELRSERSGKSASLPPELDIVDEEDINIHEVSLDIEVDTMDHLNMFSYDNDFEDNESKYSVIRNVLLGDAAAKPLPQPSSPAEEVRPVVEPKRDEAKPVAKPTDMTETDLVDFRRMVYLKIMSAASFEECAHKLVKFIHSKPGMEPELCNMVIECCSQEKSFLRYYGLLGQRLCLLSKLFIASFEEQFAKIYASIHRYDTRKIRNMSTFFASLLSSRALNWSLLSVVHLAEDETTASSRIFLKILFQEVAKTIGEQSLLEVVRDEDLPSLFPRDVPKNTRFAINFFISIGLGYLTEDLREHLKHAPKTRSIEPKEIDKGDEDDSLSSSSLSSSSLSMSSGISDQTEAQPSRKRKRDEEEDKKT